MKRRILLVDDELAILLTLKAVLELHGFDVETAASAREAKSKLRAHPYHMVITDMRMENERAGIEVVRAAREAEYDPGADQMLVKPMNTNDLVLQIEALLVTHEDKKQKAKQGVQPDYTAVAAKKSNGARRKAVAER
jgi:DNA-binding response OmpR family regulator